jgi:hypothetical protein
MTATFYAEAQKFVLVCNSATVYHIFRFSQAENRRTDIRAAVILKGDAIRRGRIFTVDHRNCQCEIVQNHGSLLIICHSGQGFGAQYF